MTTTATPVNSPIGTSTLTPPLDVMLQQTLQPGEQMTLCLLTNVDEGFAVTTARAIVLKGPTRSATGRPLGRYFPLSDIERLITRAL